MLPAPHYRAGCSSSLTTAHAQRAGYPAVRARLPKPVSSTKLMWFCNNRSRYLSDAMWNVIQPSSELEKRFNALVFFAEIVRCGMFPWMSGEAEPMFQHKQHRGVCSPGNTSSSRSMAGFFDHSSMITTGALGCWAIDVSGSGGGATARAPAGGGGEGAGNAAGRECDRHVTGREYNQH